MEQTNQTSPVRAKNAYFTLVKHLSDCISKAALLEVNLLPETCR